VQSLLNGDNDCTDHQFQIGPEFCLEDAFKFGLIVHGRPVPVVNIFGDRGSSMASAANKCKQGDTAGSFLGSCPQLYSDQCKDGDQWPTGQVDRLVE
jgi:hypothetical protein